MFLEVIAYYLAIFYIYCFLGWCFESTYVSVCNLRIENRGFLFGPFVIIYGVCAMILISIKGFLAGHMILAYFIGAGIITLVEYVTGAAMQRIFGKRYWDYSKQKFNYKGHICLSSSIAWGFMTILLIKFIHPAVVTFINLADGIGVVTAAYVATVFFIADYAESFRREYTNERYSLLHIFS